MKINSVIKNLLKSCSSGPPVFSQKKKKKFFLLTQFRSSKGQSAIPKDCYWRYDTKSFSKK